MGHCVQTAVALIQEDTAWEFFSPAECRLWSDDPIQACQGLRPADGEMRQAGNAVDELIWAWATHGLIRFGQSYRVL